MKQRRWRVAVSTALVLLFVASSVAGVAVAQSVTGGVWQTAQGDKAIAFSPDGQMLLAGTRLYRASDGALIRIFQLPYNGSGVNAVAFSPDGRYAAVGIQGYNQNLDLFRVEIYDGATR